MPRHQKDIPSGALRRVLTYFKLPQAIPARFLIVSGLLWELAEISHTTEFILKLMHAHFSGVWLILSGIIWLAGVVLWAASRPDAATHAYAMDTLKTNILAAVRRFEELSIAYEAFLPKDEGGRISVIRMHLMFDLESVITAAINTLPEDQHWHYSQLLFRVQFEAMRRPDYFPSSRFADETEPLAAIRYYQKKRFSIKDEETKAPSPPPATPPETTASE